MAENEGMKDAPGGQEGDRPRRGKPCRSAYSVPVASRRPACSLLNGPDLIMPMFLRKVASGTTNQWFYGYHIDWAA